MLAGCIAAATLPSLVQVAPVRDDLIFDCLNFRPDIQIFSLEVFSVVRHSSNGRSACTAADHVTRVGASCRSWVGSSHRERVTVILNKQMVAYLHCTALASIDGDCRKLVGKLAGEMLSSPPLPQTELFSAR